MIFHVIYDDGEAYLIEAEDIITASSIVYRLLEPGHYRIEEVIFAPDHIFPL